MSTKTMLAGILGLVGVLTVGVLLTNTSLAYQGNSEVQGPNYTPERHEAMEVAFESNDYEAWKKLMEEAGRNGMVLQKVNADNFARFAEMHRLMDEGKIEEANKIREELGLKLQGQQGKKDGNGAGKNRLDKLCPMWNSQQSAK